VVAGKKSEELFARALQVLPGGVSSPVRAFNAVGGDPFFVDHALGAYITDVDGCDYVDYVQSWGASILGHAHPFVIKAIQKAASLGTTYGAPTESEVVLAEAIASCVEGVDLVRFVSSGTEAAMTAIRIARGVTGRDRLVKFAGCYHGHSDAVLASAGSGVATLGLSDSAGVPRSAVSDTIVVPYNQLPRLDERVAAVIVEPVAANMGLVAPKEGFLQGLRAACDEVGALLIFDEVITGFRLGRAGASGYYGVRPDLFLFGKVIGGGLPLACVAGPSQVMGELAPLGPVYQAGTLSGNPLATAAGSAVLSLCDDGAYGALEQRVARLSNGLYDAISDSGLSVQVPVVGTLMGLFFTDRDVVDLMDARAAASTSIYAPFFSEMAKRHVSLAPSPYEVMFCSMAHGDEEIQATIDAAREASRVVAKDKR
jgi:glutamate-1-semialdehyde 2,1-aminomutase